MSKYSTINLLITVKPGFVSLRKNEKNPFFLEGGYDKGHFFFGEKKIKGGRGDTTTES